MCILSNFIFAQMSGVAPYPALSDHLEKPSECRLLAVLRIIQYTSIFDKDNDSGGNFFSASCSCCMTDENISPQI